MKSNHYLSEKAVQIGLFLVAFFLFLWPFLAAPCVAEPSAMFLYLFCAWAFVILICFFISRSGRDLPNQPREQLRSIE